MDANIVDKGSVLKEIKRHVEQNTVALDPTRMHCVDGRYLPDETDGAIARPGGHLGYVEGLLKIKKDKPSLNLSVEQCFGLVYEFVERKGWQFGWHSDKHADPDHDHGHGHVKPLIGCGHCARAESHSAMYGVDADDVRELIRMVRAMHAENPENSDLVILDGEHGERGVLRVYSDSLTVLPFDVDTNQQYFVYQVTADQKFCKEFAKFIKSKGIAISYDELWNALNLQTDATLALLAKGKPIFDVHLDSKQEEVQFAGTV